MVKKSYNPFKMWGSYVGGILVFLIFLFMNYQVPYCVGLPECSEIQTERVECCPPQLPFRCFGFVQETTCSFTIYLINPYGFGSFILGFLIGWGIHSSIRKKMTKTTILLIIILILFLGLGYYFVF